MHYSAEKAAQVNGLGAEVQAGQMTRAQVTRWFRQTGTEAGTAAPGTGDLGTGAEAGIEVSGATGLEGQEAELQGWS